MFHAVLFMIFLDTKVLRFTTNSLKCVKFIVDMKNEKNRIERLENMLQEQAKQINKLLDYRKGF